MSYLENFHYQIMGPEEGPRLVFLHGLLGSGANWRKVTSSLQDKYRILLYDQRGHGRSFHPTSGYRPEDYAEDLLQILDELGWKKIALVGHSMGGRNALVFAANHPERVQCLVVEDIGPDASEAGVSRIQRLLNLVPVPFSSRLEAKRFFEEDFPKRLMGKDNAVTLANYFYTNIQEQPDGTADWRFSLNGVLESLQEGHRKERWVEVEKLQCPTLWVRGEFSEDLDRDIFQQILTRRPDILGVEVAQSGHWVHFDQVAEFTRILKDFLDKNSP
ncbi:MAG: alpha/beta hydrolase [Bdellovibrionales bacterium]|nr:alpha/beta hydrolase [Bdellovibrionales bacterium]